jgi:hypothetical protein
MGSACTIVSSMLSEGSCRLDVEANCGGVLLTGFTRQETTDGSLIAGTVTVSVSGCTGTYDVTYARQ